MPAEWSAPIQEWAIAQRAAGRSQGTIATRTDHLRRCARALGGDPWAVTTAALVDWCGRQNWSRETRRGVRASLVGFWGWAAGCGYAAVSPAAGLPAVKAAPAIPRPAPEPTLKAAVLAADERTTLILHLAAYAGLRRAEIARVHARDLLPDLVGWSVRVHGKGGRIRVVPVPTWLAEQIEQRAGGGWCFPGDDAGHLSPRWVGKLATDALPGNWTLHTLRHRFASRAYAGCRDLIAVQQLLGHASVATTQRYVAAPDDALRAAMQHAAA
ncbi:tyrosine-type recombinase/integrase [Enemella evansiae]|uniref:tyrosine-type recombinase/integrase n=1 Tax=Enemella evansiae TaxID=2016499 RepID=UPI001E57C8B2|nr:tyrosine-type recombinase/integrase [Enemella evansiae]